MVTKRRRATRVEGFGGVGRGFETKARGLQVLQEGLGPLVEEVVRWLIKPPAAMPVPIGLEAEGVAMGTLIEEVVEGVGGPAAPAGELVRGDVRPEPSGVVRGERVAHRKVEGSGGGVPGVHRQGLACLGVRIRAHSLLPEGMVVAIGGFGDGVRVLKGGVGTGAGSDGPFCGPLREGVVKS